MTLEMMFNPAQRQRLLKAIDSRYSCRSFSAPPTTSDWGALSYAAQRYALPGARVVLMPVSESLFTGTLLNMGRVTGCTTVAAVIASSAERHGRLHAGILGEALCLEATALGLGSCWIAGTYKRNQLHMDLAVDETVLAVIALGVPKTPLTAKISRRRKSLEKLCSGDISLWNEELRAVAEAVRQAPSALNLQPWSLKLESDRFIVDSPERAMLDLGIALCHAELAMTTPHEWHFRHRRSDPAAWITAEA